MRFRDITQSRTSDIEEAAVKCWHQMVQQYSARDLTYDTDKLIAMEGITRPFRKSTGRTILAGLIREIIIAELSWYADSEPPTLTDPLFPSWSWASVKGMIHFRASKLSEGFLRQAQFIDCDPDQPVTGPHTASPQKLVLQGFLKRVSWTYEGEAVNTRKMNVIVAGFGRMLFENFLLMPDQETWLFLLGRGILDTDDYDDYQADFGLILTRGTDGNFRRVGLFTGDLDKDFQVSDFFDECDRHVIVIG